MEHGNSSNQLPQTTVHFKGRDLVLTLSDARQIRVALQDYLDSSKERIREQLPPNLVENLPMRVGEAWIDADGYLRMGSWLLEARGEELVLTYRVVSIEGQGGYQYLAHVNRNDQRWAVSSITYAKLLPRH